MMAFSSMHRSLLLCDGGIESLLACAWLRERLTVEGANGSGGVNPIAMPFTDQLTQPKVDAILAMTSSFGLKLVESPVEVPSQLASPGVRERSHRLLAAVYQAASLGCSEVVWPVCAGRGEEVDIERAAFFDDTAWLVSRLAALDAANHGVPSIRVTLPFVQFSAVQLAELVADMDLDPSACWWWNATDPAAKAERERWGPVLETASALPPAAR